MKKHLFAAGFMILFLLCPLCINMAQAEEQTDVQNDCREAAAEYISENEGIAVDDADIDALLTDYFAFRENSLKNGIAADTDITAQISAEVYNDEMTRRGLIASYCESLGIAVTDAASGISVNAIEEYNESSRMIDLTEWTFYNYDYTDDEITTSDLTGFATEHKLIVGQDGTGNYILTEDRYSEEDIFGMISVSYIEEYNNEEIPAVSGTADASVSPEEETVDSSADTVVKAAYYSSYDVTAAVKYSDKYVLKYNSNYFNFDPWGGDCANFVSQCLNAGGIPQTDGWYYNNNGSHSSSWTTAGGVLNWMANNYGKRIDDPKAGDIYTGSVVAYDFENDGSWDHVTFCVGQDSAGNPVVNSHSHDRYHVVWNYADSTKPDTVYSTVKMSKSNDSGSASDPSIETENITVPCKGMVNVSGTTIRSGPSTGYSYVGSLSKGDAVKIKVRSNGWYEIELSSGTGYVKADHVTPIDRVQNFSAAAYDKKIKLSWAAVNNVDGYYIYAMYGDGSKYKTYATTKTTCNFNKLVNGDKYRFKIRAYKLNPSGSRIYGYYGKEVSATPRMNAVEGLEALAFSNKIRIDWKAADGAESYYIYAAYGDGTLYKTYKTKNTYCSFTKLTNGKQYKFGVRTCYTNSSGKTVYGKYCTYKYATPYDDLVKDLTAEPETNRIRLSWSGVDKADGYYIYAMYGDGSKYKTYATTKTTCNFNNLQPGETYQFKIREYKLDQTGKRVYGSYCDVVKGTTLLPETTDLEALAFNNKIRLDWTAAEAAADGYEIYAAYEDGSLYKTYKTAKTSCNFNNLTNGSTYQFKVRTYYKDKTGKTVYGAYSDTVSAVPYDDIIINFKAEASAGAVNLSWDADENADGYTIYMESEDGSHSGSFDADGTTVAIGNLTSGTVYQFRIRGYKDDQTGKRLYGQYSETVSAAPMD